MQTAETPFFTKLAAELFTEEERRELIDFLAANPLVSDEIPGAAAFARFDLARRARANVVERG